MIKKKKNNLFFFLMALFLQFFLPIFHFSFSSQPQLDKIVIYTGVCGYEGETFFKTTNLNFQLQNCKTCEVQKELDDLTSEKLSNFCVLNCKKFVEVVYNGFLGGDITTCTFAVSSIKSMSDFLSDNFLESNWFMKILNKFVWTPSENTTVFFHVPSSFIFSEYIESFLGLHNFYDDNHGIIRFKFCLY